MYLEDSLTNLVSGMGTEKDKVGQGHFRHQFVSKVELDALYTSNWLAGSIVDAPCDDMTREWRSWKAGPRQIQAIEVAERKFRVRQRVNLALKQARQYGGSGILIGTGDPDPSQPLDPARVGKGGLQYLHVLSRYELTADQVDRDPMSPTFGEPVRYHVFSQDKGSVEVHPTRVVRFLGQSPLEITYSVQGWGLPTLQRVFDAVRDATSAARNLSNLTNEAKVDVFSIKGLTANVKNPEYRAAMIMRFGLANQSKSINNALLLDAEEKWEQKKVSLAEFPAVVRMFLEIAAGAGNMPVTRLLGTSAKGLNATGDGDIRHYYDTLSSRQEVELRPALERLDEVLVRSAIGSYPPNLWYEWNPLWQMTEAELSAISLQKAQTTQIYAALGVMPKDALIKAAQGQLLEDGLYPGLDQILSDNADQKAEPLTAPAAKPVDPGKVVENIASNLGGLKE